MEIIDQGVCSRNETLEPSRPFTNRKINPNSEIRVKTPDSLNQAPPQRKTLTIPWRHRILTPTFSELRKYKGNLEDIEKALGSRPPTNKESTFNCTRIVWNGKVMWVTPLQLLNAEGDLDTLSTFPSITKMPPKSPVPIRKSQNTFDYFRK